MNTKNKKYSTKNEKHVKFGVFDCKNKLKIFLFITYNICTKFLNIKIFINSEKIYRYKKHDLNYKYF